MGQTLTSRIPSSFSFAKRALSDKVASLKTSAEALPAVTKRAKKPNENFWGMLSRMLRAGSRRVEQPCDLADLLRMEAQLKEAIHTASLNLRRQGYSLGDIAQALGCSQMNVSKRWRLPSDWSSTEPGGEA